ncbi:MAG TPA: RecQ family ATP-dependent DNA helicase [Candidatus Angelobacter sp.]|nr:RecQ family ATP-dependent DNA helicase [Candidatus Angelobacter sp.]
MNDSAPLRDTLKKVFGFTSFRPLQEQIIRDTLAGRDVFAVLPTGGGKSLCFQLPALVRPGLTVVVSPLIALMKDQVDALQAAGVPATFLNSSLAAGESRPRLHGLHNREFRLLYVAPERLMLSGFLEDLKRWNVNLFAIDEAHCISEWGHDFRPEYRQINSLRGVFPDVPMMALTATATERVRADIITQLHLRSTACYVASFNRPNLTYRVSAKSGAYEQITDFIRARPGESGIIYCQARKTAESLASKLNVDGVRAAAYHAGMETDDRSRSQEAFLRDEVRVVCATIAFGMGINKPNVRFVIHYDLPKNIEGYYQETGRAGRDGLPSECLLLFSPGDRVKYSRFIDEMTNPKERDIARAQLEQIVHYAESASCRRAFLLNYFGESYNGRSRREEAQTSAQKAGTIPSLNNPPNASSIHPLPSDGRGQGEGLDEGCSACDNCLSPRETWDGTLAAQKFLSCVYRIREKSGFSVGVQHVVEVLCGAETDRIRKWNHQSLSTYNIGAEHSRPEWSAIGRELVRLGFLHQHAENFNTLELTNEGRSALKSRQKITLTRAVTAPEPAKHRAGEISCDEVLFDRLRQLRKRLADERSVPPYIIFSDVSLRQMARNYPADERSFSRISGVGEKKLREFGAIFMSEIAAHLQTNARQVFAEEFEEAVAPPPRSKLNDTVRETLHFFRQEKSVEEIASSRGLKESTIYGHLEDAIRAGESIELGKLLDEKQQREIASAFERHGFGNLTGAVESLGGRYSHGQLRIYRAAAQLSA